jgi:hypothetical protein
MKHMKLFEEFIIERVKEDYSDSPFKRCPELCVKKKTGDKMPGDLSRVGELAHLIYLNPGLSEKELINLVLGLPANTSQKDTYYNGGHQVTNMTSAALQTPYVKRTSTRPARYYAHPDPNLTIDELVEKFKGSIHGKEYGI